MRTYPWQPYARLLKDAETAGYDGDHKRPTQPATGSGLAVWEWWPGL